MSVTARFSDKRPQLTEQLSCIADALRDLLLLKKSESISLTFFADLDVALELCDRASLHFLYRLMESVQAAIDACSQNANVKLVLMRLLTDANLI